jgi:DNA-binding MarR family transcriptional regulator
MTTCLSRNVPFASYSTSLWVRFLRFNLSSHKSLESVFGEVGVTPPQFYFSQPSVTPAALPFGEIGAKMMVTVSNLTGIVTGWSKKLVLRKRDETDRRVLHLTLTDKGDNLYKTTFLFERSISEIFS